MKTFRADEELIHVISNFGFKEFTSDSDKIKGKKLYRQTLNSKRGIYFDYINIRIIDAHKVLDLGTSITENELKILLLYFLLSPGDREDYLKINVFNLESMAERLDSLSNELEGLKEFGYQKVRQNKIERILQLYNSLNI